MNETIGKTIQTHEPEEISDGQRICGPGSRSGYQSGCPDRVSAILPPQEEAIFHINSGFSVNHMETTNQQNATTVKVPAQDPHYKWIALSNTTIAMFMAAVNGSILLISLPAIFNGIHIDPLTSFQYLLWIMMGYGIVTATLLLSFGRLSDMYGRVRLYNIGFAIFTIGSLLLFLTPDTGDAGAIELIVFRLIQAVGAAFIFSNSAAILTDAFPPDERGTALGLNQVASLAGQFIGLIIGGILAVFNWRYVFLISVPFGVFGTIWAFLKSKSRPTRSGPRRSISGETSPLPAA